MRMDRENIDAELDWKSADRVRSQMATKVMTIIGRMDQLLEGELKEINGKEEEPDELKDVVKVAEAVVEVRKRKDFTIEPETKRILLKFEEAGLLWIGTGTVEGKIKKWKKEQEHIKKMREWAFEGMAKEGKEEDLRKLYEMYNQAGEVAKRAFDMMWGGEMANDTPFVGANFCEEQELVDKFGITVERHEEPGHPGRSRAVWKIRTEREAEQKEQAVKVITNLMGENPASALTPAAAHAIIDILMGKKSGSGSRDGKEIGYIHGEELQDGNMGKAPGERGETAIESGILDGMVHRRAADTNCNQGREKASVHGGQKITDKRKF